MPVEGVQSPSASCSANMQTSTTSSSSEVVYGANSLAGSEESARVMSEKVQMLASSIYKELELMIQKNGEESVKELMPLVVNVLENLDLAYLDKDEQVVDLEMLKEENEQLLNQYERERQMRKGQDQKYLEQEDLMNEQIRDLEGKITNMEAELRRFELKARNANDHVSRCEEREAEQKMEFEKLHERYNELLRTHIDHVERTKYLMGSDKFDMMQSLPQGHNRGMTASVDTNVRGISDIISAAHMTQSTHVNVNLANHISGERDYHEEFGQNTEDLLNSGRDEGNPIVDDLEQHLRDNGDDGQDTDRSGHDQETEDDCLAAQLTGMGREVDNLIKENTELLETKNALNVVKNDLIAQVDQFSSENEVLREEIRTLDMVKAKQGERLAELESELKELKDKMNSEEQDDQDDIPMAQRKRFTRVEMARVLMERNQYKEKLMELQEAIKFTELQRAKKMSSSHPASKSRIWDFFSGLFGETQQPTSSLSAKRSQRSASAARKQKITRNFDLDMDSVQEKRMTERRQQYKAVSQHMKKEDESRTRAYGWSIPSSIDASSTHSIPVPVCCRPLLDQQPSLKIWCAAGALLHGGKEIGGGYIISDSIFYSDPLKGLDMNSTIGLKLIEERPIWEASSLVWVCSSNERRSYLTILDANNPNCVLECFSVCTSHLLCISSVAGVRENDYVLEEDGITKYSRNGGYLEGVPADIGATETFGHVSWTKLRASEVDGVPTFCSEDEMSSPRRTRDFSVNDAPADSSTDSAIDITDDNEQRNLTAYANLPPHIRDALSKYENQSEMESALPTMWMGLENDFIFIHSAVLNWRKCLLRIKMADAVLHILHHNGRVFAALANGCIAVFHRDKSGKWSTDGYHVIRLGQANSSVCNLTVVHDKIWAAYRNCVIILNPDDLTIENSFVAHPRKDSQVRHMAWSGDGVWLSIRLDSTIRLYHSKTLKHLQDVDIEPYLSNMLGNTKMDFLHLRISSLVIFNRKLWIGTGTGVIIAVPLSNESKGKVEIVSTESNKNEAIRQPGSLVRVYAADPQTASDSFIPYCNISLSQFSFHGHKDCVRFFVCVPADGVSSLTQSLETKKILMLSGGDGYIDFRLGEDDEDEKDKTQVRIRDMSHLIVWEIDSPNPYKVKYSE